MLCGGGDRRAARNQAADVARQMLEIAPLIAQRGGPIVQHGAVAGNDLPGWDLRQLFHRLLEVSLMLEEDIRCAGHGDYSCKQILFAGNRTVACDWDGYDTVDPCRDAVRFVVALERLALTEFGFVQGLNAASEAFLKTYLITAHPRFVTRLGFYRAVQYLQSAKRDVNNQAAGGLERAEIMVDEGLRALDQIKGGGRGCRN